MRITPPTAQTTSATTMAMATSGFLLDSWHGWLLKSTRVFSNRKYTSSSPPGSFNLPASFPISPHHHHHHHQHHHRQQNLLGEDREGLCRAWRFATWRASSRKAAWYVMTSGYAFFLACQNRWNFAGSHLPNMLSSKPGTLQSFLILVVVFLGFWVATPHIRRHATIPRKFMHGWTLCSIRLPTCEPRENPPCQVGTQLHLQTTFSTDSLLLNNLYHMIKIN